MAKENKDVSTTPEVNGSNTPLEKNSVDIIPPAQDELEQIMETATNKLMQIIEAAPPAFYDRIEALNVRVETKIVASAIEMSAIPKKRGRNEPIY